MSVAPTDTEALRYAATLPLSDFEDAMQVAAARACGAEVIATRNVADSRSSPIPARTPGKLLAELG
ncbi:MAG TPA: PIN domain-containing protein [Longimicrobiales bacterium]|nr:PIN domain-containing protein [Longimicrobiales bacterium]